MLFKDQRYEAHKDNYEDRYELDQGWNKIMRNDMSWAKNLMLVITSIVLSLFTLEFGLHLIYPEKAEFQS